VNLNGHSESVSYTYWKSQTFYLKTKDNQEVKQMSSTFHHPSSTPPFLAPSNSKAHVLLNQTSPNHCKSKAIPISTPRPKTKSLRIYPVNPSTPKTPHPSNPSRPYFQRKLPPTSIHLPTPPPPQTSHHPRRTRGEGPARGRSTRTIR
jgi:hypothetical protein